MTQLYLDFVELGLQSSEDWSRDDAPRTETHLNTLHSSAVPAVGVEYDHYGQLYKVERVRWRAQSSPDVIVYVSKL